MIPIEIKTNIPYDKAAMFLLATYGEKTINTIESWTYERFKDTLSDIVFNYGMQRIYLFNYIYADLEHLILEVKSTIYEIENRV